MRRSGHLRHIASNHRGSDAPANVPGLHAAHRAARGAIGKLVGALQWGRDDAPGADSSISPTVMLTQDERDDAVTWRARAIAELRSIQEDGLLGRRWRKHPRTLFLLGYLRGTHHCLAIDNAARN